MLLKILKIEVKERTKIAYIAILFFSVFFYNVTLETITQAVFNNKVGVDYLPLMFAIMAFTFTIGAAGLSKILTLFDKRKVFIVFMMLAVVKHFFGIVILFLPITNKIIISAYFILSISFIYTATFSIWIILQEVVDIEFGKKYFGIITATGIIGAIAGSSYVTYLTEFFGAAAIYALAIIFPFIAAISGSILLKRYKYYTFSENNENFNKITLKETLNYLTKNKFYFNMLVFGALLFIAVYTIDYQFNFVADSQLKTTDAQSVFFGFYMQLRSLISLFYLLFCFSRIVYNFGALPVSFILPATAIAAGVLTLVSKNIYIILCANLLINIFIMAQLDALFQIFYQPIKRQYKFLLIGLLEGSFQFVGLLGAGLLGFLHSVNYINYDLLGYIIIFIGFFGFILWKKNSENFTVVLGKSITASPDMDLKSIFGKNISAEFISIIKSKINDGNEIQKIIIIDLLHKLSFAEKTGIIVNAYKNSGKSIKNMIIDGLFESTDDMDKIGILKNIIYECDEISDKLRLLEKCFLFYADVPADLKNMLIQNIDVSAFEKFVEKKEYYTAIYFFLKDFDDKYLYDIIDLLIVSKTTENILLAVKIIKIYYSTKAEIINTIAAKIIMLFKTLSDKFIKTEMIEVIALFDRDLCIFEENIYFDYNFNVINKSLECYPTKKLFKFLESRHSEIPAILFYTGLICKNEFDELLFSGHSENNLKLILHIENMIADLNFLKKSKADKKNIVLIDLLVKELQTLTTSILIVSVKYILNYYGLRETGFVDEALMNKNKTAALIEILVDTLPRNLSKKYLSLIQRENFNIANSFETVEFNKWQKTFISIIADFLGGKNMSQAIEQTIERLVILKSVPMFSELTADELFLISHHTDFIYLNKDDVLIKEGDEGNDLYVIIKGNVGVYKNFKSPNEKQIAELDDGIVLGEMAVISNNKRSATIIALDNTTLLSMDGRKFMELLPTNSSISLKLIQALAAKINNTALAALL